MLAVFAILSLDQWWKSTEEPPQYTEPQICSGEPPAHLDSCAETGTDASSPNHAQALPIHMFLKLHPKTLFILLLFLLRKRMYFKLTQIIQDNGSPRWVKECSTICILCVFSFRMHFNYILAIHKRQEIHISKLLSYCFPFNISFWKSCWYFFWCCSWSLFVEK